MKFKESKKESLKASLNSDDLQEKSLVLDEAIEESK